ncbi:MAG TPA: type I methionyl aminopeptidase [Bacteroidetes bacterium]|nr:type I methionyl aminopeptidase [Bacteroidota bacterium]
MIVFKSNEEIEILRENNLLVSQTLAEVGRYIKPGMTTRKLDQVAEEFIRDHGAIPGFKGYQGFPATLCTSVNDQVVHGIPSGYELREGDIISIDCGVVKNGFYGDSAFTFAVGEISPDKDQLLRVTRESLEKGVKQAIAGNRVGDIGYAVQSYAEEHGFSVVRELVGHGLGKNLHEAPEVPNYGKRGRGPKLKVGMVICIEPMINMGVKDVYQDRDGWTIHTADGKPSAHFEYAVAVRKNNADVLTTFKYVDKVLNQK